MSPAPTSHGKLVKPKYGTSVSKN
jgi:hypothetical protein